jgi:cobalt transporter subunit CbtA
MVLLRRLIGTALLAGVIAGLVLSAARQVWVVPLILSAEDFEIPSDGHAGHGGRPAIRAAAPERSEAPAVWQPAAGLERHAWTWAANSLTGFGFAVLLVCAYSLSGRAVDAKRGLLWGCAGFLAASGAPALGLPPALPGAPEAGLAARQVWWLGTVAATAGGLALLAFGGAPWRRLLGLPLLALPHLIGAPRAGEALPAALAALTARFIAATLLINLGFWLLLGLVSGWAWRRGAGSAGG